MYSLLELPFVGCVVAIGQKECITPLHNVECVTPLHVCIDPMFVFSFYPTREVALPAQFSAWSCNNVPRACWTQLKEEVGTEPVGKESTKDVINKEGDS